MTRALVTALRTLTILPVPGRESADFTRSLPFFPLAGALLGAILWALHLLMRRLLPGLEQVEAVVLLLVAIGLTGGLHLDGLADVADAFGGGRGDRERTLRILKDTHLGTFGAAAVGLDLLLKSALYAACLRAGAAPLIGLSLVFSRLAQAFLLACLPYARGREGTAFPFSDAGRQRPALAAALLLWLALAGLAAGSIAHRSPAAGVPGGGKVLSAATLAGPAAAMAAAALAAGVPAAAFALAARRRLGGITGDCLGAANEIYEAAFLLAALALAPWFLPA